MNGDDHFVGGMTVQEFFDRFRRVESLSETDPSPIVRQVRDNTKTLENHYKENEDDHKRLRFQVYFFMAAVAGAVGAALAIRNGVVP